MLRSFVIDIFIFSMAITLLKVQDDHSSSHKTPLFYLFLLHIVVFFLPPTLIPFL